VEIGKTRRIIESDPVKDPVPDRAPNNPLPVPEPQPSPTKEPAKAWSVGFVRIVDGEDVIIDLASE